MSSPCRPLLPLLALLLGCPRPAPPVAAPTPRRLGEEVVVWRRDLGAALGGEPLLAEGVLWFGDEAGTVHALEAASGRELLVAPLRPDAFLPILARPALGGGSLFVADAGGRVAALDPASGAARWVVDLKGEVRAPLLTDGRTLWVASAEYGLVALDAASGAERWRRVSQQRWFSLALEGADALCATGFTNPVEDALTLCVARESGEERSREPTGQQGRPPAPPVAVCGERVRVGEDGAILSEDELGAPLWRHPRERPESAGAPALSAAEGLVIVREGPAILAISPPSCPTGAIAPAESSR